MRLHNLPHLVPVWHLSLKELRGAGWLDPWHLIPGFTCLQEHSAAAELEAAQWTGALATETGTTGECFVGAQAVQTGLDAVTEAQGLHVCNDGERNKACNGQKC